MSILPETRSGSGPAAKLRAHGLRPTKQRLALAKIIFAGGHRHIAAEELHREATAAGCALSLATVYNSLQRFAAAGLLRIIAGEGPRRWFDTDISDHHHFYIEETQTIMDAPAGENGPPVIDNLPRPPAGMEIAQIDLMIKLRQKKPARGSKAEAAAAKQRLSGKQL